MVFNFRRGRRAAGGMRAFFNLEVLCAVAGVAAAFLFVFSGFRDEGKAKSLAENPRFKNLSYLLGGGILVAITDWKQISSDADRGQLITVYAEVVLFASLASGPTQSPSS